MSLPNLAFGEVKINLLNDDFTYTDMGILDRTHIRFFTYGTIANLFAEAGFKVTQCLAKVADIPNRGDVPFKVRRWILKDPHTFIYQYLVKAIPSSATHRELYEHNLRHMNVDHKQIKDRKKEIQRQRLINRLLPVSSKRRQFCKSILHKFRKR